MEQNSNANCRRYRDWEILRDFYRIIFIRISYYFCRFKRLEKKAHSNTYTDGNWKIKPGPGDNRRESRTILNKVGNALPDNFGYLFDKKFGAGQKELKHDT